MRTALLALVSGAALLFSGVAFADQNDQPVTAQKVSMTNDDTVICHNYVHEGNLMTVHDCATAREWTMRRSRDQELFRSYQMHGLLMNNR
jgi:hypothetical protein